MIFGRNGKTRMRGVRMIRMMHGRRALVTALSLSMVLCATAPAAAATGTSPQTAATQSATTTAATPTNAITSVLRFTDVPETDEAYADIKALCDASLIDGYPDGTFKPEGTITRAEFVKMINSAFGFTATNGISNPFSDIATSQWHFTNVMAAVTKGYILGYEDGTFRPDATITRQETAVIIDRIMMLENTVSDEQMAAVTINDSVGAWASNSVKRVVAAGLMNAGSDGSFRASVPATRAEIAVTCVASLDTMGRVDALGRITPLDGATDKAGSTDGSGTGDASGSGSSTDGYGTGDASGSGSGSGSDGGSGTSSDSSGGSGSGTSGGTSTADYQTMSAVKGTIRSIEETIIPKIEASTVAADKKQVLPLLESVLESMKAYQKDQSYNVEKNAEKVKAKYDKFSSATQERVKYYIGFISTQNLSILGEKFFGIDINDYM